MASLSQFEPVDLTVSERLELISRLWDSIPDTPDGLPLPDWHRQKLSQRIAEADANPDAGIPWERVRESMRRRTKETLT